MKDQNFTHLGISLTIIFSFLLVIGKISHDSKTLCKKLSLDEDEMNMAIENMDT